MPTLCTNNHDDRFRQSSNLYNCESCHNLHSHKDDGWGMLLPSPDYHANCKVCHSEGRELKSDIRSASQSLVDIKKILEKKKKGDPKTLLDQLYTKINSLIYHRLLASDHVFRGTQTYNSRFNELKDALVNINYALGYLHDTAQALQLIQNARNNVSVSDSDLR